MSDWPRQTPENVIVRMPNWVGDLVMATPVLAGLRERFPHAKITAMCLAGMASLLKEDPHVDEVYAFCRPSGWLRGQPYREIIKTLQRGNYDLGLLLTNSLSSAWWFCRGSVKNRIGFATHFRTALLNKAVSVPKNFEKQHLVLTYQQLLLPLGMTQAKRSPCLYLSADEKRVARDYLRKLGVGDNQIVVGVNPGAAYGSAKCWLPARFREVTQKLLSDPLVRVVYFGDQAGAPLVNDICNGLPEQVINLAGKTSLRELVALIDQCAILLTNDSGPMHIAAALGRPLVALFGSTNEVKTGPYPAGVVIHKHVECSPCYKRICPIDFRCMTRIGVEEVYSALQQQLCSQQSKLHIINE